MDLTEGFSYTGSAQNFERDSYATLAEMKAVKAKKMPNIFIATCEETGKLYIYNKQNEDDEVLGKWREVNSGSSAGGASGGSENLFNNDGPNLDIYSFTQGHKTSDEMFELIGNSYYAKYSGDYGRGNEPFIPGFGGRADSATVYIENAPMFGTSKCRLFATNNKGQVFEGFFVTTNTIPTFTSNGLVWREIEAGEALTESKVKNMIEANSPVAVAYAKEIYSNMSAEELCVFLKELRKNVYKKTNSFDDITVEDLSGNNNKITIEDFTRDSHNEPIDPTTMDRVTEYALHLKYGDENVTVRATENLSGKYTKSVPSDINIKVSAIDPDFVESDTIDFSTWPEFSANVETNGVVLDGNGGANVDNSNVSVDPEDIEDDD